mmetsp:Transcript_21551/g.10012  ORF Transcript_21551/g.10012 Transcript_21551/m.10012 type:complete len:281 (-) Transcript_21551:1337-2179(-)
MFTKKVIVIVSVVMLVVVSFIILSFSSRYRCASFGFGRNVIIYCAVPFQKAIIHTTRFVRDVWETYFYLVSVAKENKRLKKELKNAEAENHHFYETELLNKRLLRLLGFKKRLASPVVAAEVISRELSPWFKSIIIDKGEVDEIKKGLPVVVPEGIVGQITDVFYNHSKVLLLTDWNSAVDALIQRTRARGIVKGIGSSSECVFKYSLRKQDIIEGDTVISSGLDKVFPKGLRIGQISSVVNGGSGIFQKVALTPYVDFEKFEEVLVLQNLSKRDFTETS